MELSSNSKKIQNILKGFGMDLEVIEIPDSTRTSAEAAKAVDCELSQIAKSVLFKSKSGKPVLIIASGSNRVDESQIEGIIGESIGKADANFVKEKTGFPIGGGFKAA